MSVREDILAAGVGLLRQQGIAALTQPRVAWAAGVKQSHLTYYFPTRADLMLGIAEQAIASLSERLAGLPAGQASQATLARAVAEVMIAGVPPRVVIGLVVAADADPEIRKRLRRLVRGVRRRIAALLAQAGLAADKDAALLFHGAVVGFAVMHQARQSRESAAEVKAGVAAVLRLLAGAGRVAEQEA